MENKLYIVLFSTLFAGSIELAASEFDVSGKVNTGMSLEMSATESPTMITAGSVSLIPAARRSHYDFTVRRCASIPPQLSPVIEGYNSSDDESSQTSSPRKRSESLFSAIDSGEYGDASFIVIDLAREGKFSSSIADQAGDKLRFASLSPRTYKNVSPQDYEQTIQQALDITQLVATINAGIRANLIVAGASKAGRVNYDKLSDKVDRILNGNN